MGDSKIVSPATDAADDNGSSIIRVKNADELRLAQMGRFTWVLHGLLLTIPRP
jgi:hypothetical protein